jgi:threonine/homoserine/homoserine lactone efflux protein
MDKMIDSATLFTYVAIVLGFVFIPGPATLLTVARATSSGTKVGIATGAGIAAGDVIHTFMAIIGISAIIATSAVLFSVIKYLGAAYLVYLGVRAILTKAPLNLSAGALPLGAGRAFRQAILAEVLNPKTALFFIAFLPQFVRLENGSVALQLTTLGIIFVLLGLVSTVAFAVCAGKLGDFLRRNPTVLKWQGKVVGGIYCALGLRLALQER